MRHRLCFVFAHPVVKQSEGDQGCCGGSRPKAKATAAVAHLLKTETGLLDLENRRGDSQRISSGIRVALLVSASEDRMGKPPVSAVQQKANARLQAETIREGRDENSAGPKDAKGLSKDVARRFHVVKRLDDGDAVVAGVLKGKGAIKIRDRERNLGEPPLIDQIASGRIGSKLQETFCEESASGGEIEYPLPLNISHERKPKETGALPRMSDYTTNLRIHFS